MSVFILYAESQYTHNLSGTLHGLTFLNQTIGTEKHNTDLASFQVHAHALDPRSKPFIVVSG